MALRNQFGGGYSPGQGLGQIGGGLAEGLRLAMEFNRDKEKTDAEQGRFDTGQAAAAKKLAYEQDPNSPENKWKSAQAWALMHPKAPNNGLPEGMRLKPGERYNKETDTVEAMPGSNLYQEQAGKHNKDLMAKQSAETIADMGTKKVDSILNDPSAFSSLFGKAYSGKLTSLFNPDAVAKLEGLKSSLAAQGLNIIRSGGQSIGAISEREWPIVRDQIAHLDTSLSEDQAKDTLNEIKARLEGMKNKMDEAYGLEWGNTQFTKPMRTEKNGTGAVTPPAKFDPNALAAQIAARRAAAKASASATKP